MAVLISEIFAFLVILYVLYRFVVPPVRTMIKNRQEHVQQQVDDAEEAERLLAEAEQRYEKAVSEARDEAARMRDDARADSTRIREELTEAAKREMERLRQRGQDQLVAQRDQAVRGLRGEVGGQSMDLAERLVVERLSDDTQRSGSVDSFLAELDGLSPRARQTTPAGGGS